MKNFKRKKRLRIGAGKMGWISYILVLIVAVLLLARTGIISPDGGNVISDNNTPNLIKGVAVGQSLKAPSDLSGISLKLDTHGSRDIGILYLNVFKKSDGKLITHAERTDRVFAPDEVIVFNFNPIPKGSYYFEISNSDPEGKAPAVKMSVEDNYKDGDYFLNGKKSTGDLWFQVNRRYPFTSFLWMVSGRLSKDWFKFIPRYLYIALFAAYILLAIVLVGYMANLRDDRS